MLRRRHKTARLGAERAEPRLYPKRPRTNGFLMRVT